MRFVEWVSRPRVVVIVLGIVLAVNGFLLYQRQATPPESGGGVPAGNETRDDVGITTEQSGAEYLGNVGAIQNASVETLVSSNDKLLRYDTLSAGDVEDLESNHLALAGYRDQVDNLDPPEEYNDHYGTFSAGISELSEAGRIAHLLAADPVSAAQDDFRAYSEHVDRATTLLQQSNEILGEDYKTTEGLRLPTWLG